MIPVPLGREFRPGLPRYHRPKRARLPLELAAAVLWVDKIGDAAQASFAIGLVVQMMISPLSASCSTAHNFGTNEPLKFENMMTFPRLVVVVILPMKMMTMMIRR